MRTTSQGGLRYIYQRPRTLHRVDRTFDLSSGNPLTCGNGQPLHAPHTRRMDQTQGPPARTDRCRSHTRPTPSRAVRRSGRPSAASRRPGGAASDPPGTAAPLHAGAGDHESRRDSGTRCRHEGYPFRPWTPGRGQIGVGAPLAGGSAPMSCPWESSGGGCVRSGRVRPDTRCSDRDLALMRTSAPSH